LADKSTRLMLDALSRAAAEPAGLPLFAAKSAPGLFPATTSAKAIAQRCRDDGLIQARSADGKICTITDKGLQWLVSRSSPRQVLEDFLRVLEQKQAQTAELIAAARQMAGGLESLKGAIERLTPTLNGQAHHSTPGAVFHPSPSVSGGEGMGVRGVEAPIAGSTPLPPKRRERGEESPACDVVSLLDEWRATSSGDCPLPELYRRLCSHHDEMSIGCFHDLLRELHDAHRVYLHPWTGPLYELPEPPLALLVGHEIAYYASSRFHGGNP
jgi:hypothetical protein